jgi:amino acid adenylation domain-containing protein
MQSSILPRPLSFAQERLWWSARLTSAADTVVVAIQLRGEIQLPLLRQALRALVARHPMLRARFRLEQGLPLQEIVPSVEIELPEVDLQHLPFEVRQVEAERQMAELVAVPLDPASPPMFRPIVYVLGPHLHFLVIRLSHLLVDERSRQLLMQEMEHLYSSLVTGSTPQLPPLQAEYTEFALRERSELTSSAIESSFVFWERYLAGLPPQLEIPLDFPRPASRSLQGAWRSVQLGLPLRDRIQALARAERVTPFHLLLSAFLFLLSRLAQREDVAIGTPFSRLPDERYASVIGPFLNSLVIRARCSMHLPFRDFVRHVRVQATSAIANSRIPFEMVVDRLRPDRDPSYNPLIQSWFIYKVQPPASGMSSPIWKGPEMVPLELHEAVMPFDLTLALAEHTGGLTCSCTYDTALFREQTVDRFIRRYRQVLEQMVNGLDHPLDQYEAVLPEERETCVVEWNRTAKVWDSPLRLDQAVMQSATRNLDRLAAISDTGRLTYRDLAQKSNAVAKRLGVKADARVAVLLPRNPELIVALVGILRAGAAFVPLDVSTPAKRIHQILRDARPSIIVASRATRGLLGDAECPVLLIEDLDHDDASFESPAIDARNLCYLLYTSGTTGEPKGVAITHEAAMNALLSFRDALLAGPSDTTLAITTVTFDISVLELFLPLITGGFVSLAPEHSGGDPNDLIRRMERDGVTILQATPSTLRLLADAGWRPAPGMRVLSGGDALPANLAHLLVRHAGQMWNFYGPTETTIYSTFDWMSSAEDPITIGRPIANTSTYVLDPRFRPLPLGVPGEIFISGVGLARCYWNRPSLTATVFVPDPFHPTPGSRMYRTGDFGRFRDDGRVECHGRRDQQVKLNGRRIELGAIVEVLNQYPAVRESAVSIHRSDGEQTLVGYVVVDAPAGAISRASIREHLAQTLPPFLLPSAIVVLDRLPQTARGKVDRQALPAPTAADFQCAPRGVDPRNEIEAMIAALWRELLQASDFGVEEDFFALGGTSLQVVRLLQQVRDRLEVEVPLQSFLESPTIASLARHVQQRSSKPSSRRVPRLDRSTPLALAPQQENWWYNEYLAGNLHPSNVHFGLRLTGPLRLQALQQTLSFLRERHEAFRTAFVPFSNGGASIHIAPPGSSELEISQTDLQTLAPEAQAQELRRLAGRELTKPFDLAHGNLWRVLIATTHEANHIVFFTIHHLVFDNWSMEILLRDASAAYSAAVQNAPSPRLPALAFQYADFAQWQRQWLMSAEADRQFAYWQSRLASPLRPLLPEWQSREEDAASSCFSIRARLPVHFGSAAVGAARRLARSERCTAFSVLMTALKFALYAFSQNQDLRVGTLIANRNLPGCQDVIGLFTNAVCIRTAIDPGATFRQHVAREHAAIGEATAHQEVPFETVVRHVEDGRENVLHAMMVWLAMPATASMQFSGLVSSAYRDEESANEEAIVLSRSSVNLRFELVESDDEISGNTTYNTALYTDSDLREIVRLMEYSLIRAEESAGLTIEDLRHAASPAFCISTLT